MKIKLIFIYCVVNNNISVCLNVARVHAVYCANGKHYFAVTALLYPLKHVDNSVVGDGVSFMEQSERQKIGVP